MTYRVRDVWSITPNHRQHFDKSVPINDAERLAKKGCSILRWVACGKEGCRESEGYKVD